MRRMTQQRRVILEELREMKQHPTAEEVYWVVRERLPKISLGTVYRNLDVLSNEGEIRRLDWAGAKARYDGGGDDHYHARCVRCGAVADIARKELRLLRQTPSEVHGFEILGYRLEFEGICPQCRQEPQ